MKTARITSITPDGDWFNKNTKKQMYAFIVAFDDGTEGQANALSANAPYRIGDSVGYEVTGETPQGTTKLKIDRKFGQTAGMAPQVRQAQAPRQPSQQPVQVGAGDAQAFHNTLRKFCLLWVHSYSYAGQVEEKCAQAGLPLLSPEQKQALVASLFIAAKDAGLAQHPPKFEPITKQQPTPVPQPIQRAQQQNVAEAMPANGDDSDSVPF